MKKLLLLLPLIGGLFLTGQSQENASQINWDQLPALPPAIGENIQPGLAGAFIGIHEDVLILAGGANFPNGPAWEGGKKVYHKAIYVLGKAKDGKYIWKNPPQERLSKEVAYGLSISTKQGLLCIGGMNNTAYLENAFMLKWNKSLNKIEQSAFPSLPVAMANMSGGIIDDQIFVAGSDEKSGRKHFLTIHINEEEKEWKELPLWPGSPRTHAFGAVQNNGVENCFYLMKGRWRQENGISEILEDGYVYHPKSKKWTKLRTEKKFPLSAGTGLAVGANHIFLFGGDDGKTFNRLENLGLAIQSSVSDSAKRKLEMERDSLMKFHSGFSHDIWAFHTLTESWSLFGQLPRSSQVTTTAINWQDQIIIPSGEVSPCIRTDEVFMGRFDNKQTFGLLNSSIVICYLLFLAGMGIYFSRKQENLEDFFKAGKRIPAWAAGISIFGTQLSAITFMAIPAKTFATDWIMFLFNMTIILVAPFIIGIFLPFYRRFNLTTAYEYLELRFNLATRLIGSFMYILLQIGRLGIVLLLPALALSVVSGIDVKLCILSMGILSILYTVLGGIEAVIWTDVLQVFILLGGAILCLVLLGLEIDFEKAGGYVSEFGKMKMVNLSFDLTDTSLWVILFGGLATNLIQYGSDQTVIQRYLTTRDEQEAAKSIWIGAWLSVPASLLFFALGTCLFLFYKSQPDLLNPILSKTDSIFPWYIVDQLPAGISGLLVAGIFAASMSSLDSSMNSVSTVVTTDYIKRLRPLKQEKNYLRTARILTVLVGILGTSLALFMATWGISSLWDQFNLIIGLFAGGLGGIFLLGMLSTRANGHAALWALVFSGGVQYVIKSMTDAHFLLYSCTGMLTAISIGYLLSFFIGENTENKLAYTWTQVRNKNS
ncbi:hypothetical protein AB832_06810 [Flavobacteriaceae bacterium (ex Bugula neritina AB1)]|nr:hypothetical protein AB832_06810 [Flavobacteriaceae bacterium (ex Bugula neritina AB1)]